VISGVPAAASRRVEITTAAGERIWVHALDSWHGKAHQGEPEVTLVCVHGNPTWSYLWRRLIELAPPGWRVVAFDQVGMGWSDRVPGVRPLATRVTDMGLVLEALKVTGPVVTVAHDWGGPVSLGWALAHRDQLVGVVLANTAVSQPVGSPAPRLIRAVRTPGLLHALTTATPTFVRGTLRLAPTTYSPEIRAGYLAPYRDSASRQAVGDFVEDIPLDSDHPSFAALAAIADGVTSLDVPVFLIWGPSDPVFSDLYLDDLQRRMPHADVQRYEGASHLVTEDAPAALPDVVDWVARRVLTDNPAEPDLAPHAQRQSLLHELQSRIDDESLALAAPAGNVTWRELNARVEHLASGLTHIGIRAGDRVGLLVRPGADLIACVYACWSVGAVVVVADGGLGARGIRRALTGAALDHLIAIPQGMAAAFALGIRVSGRKVVVSQRAGVRASTRADHTLAEVETLGVASPVAAVTPAPDSDAVVVFTSGATGPAKAVLYCHGALEAQRDALRSLYSISSSDALVAAFAPWAVLGPALGIASAVPDVDVTRAATLTAAALADAAHMVNATLVWASPAALANAVHTARDLTGSQREALNSVRLVMSAGAPVPMALLEQASTLMPNAQAHTPYGMTEVLPVADISLDELRKAGVGNGVCVGQPVEGVQLHIDRFDSSESGEILVLAAHGKTRYDRLWATETATREGQWHRTGDVGHIDPQGRLWVEGRLAHVLSAAGGPVTPVAAEQLVESLPQVKAAALVGVGPEGGQQPVVIVVATAKLRGVVAPLELIDAVREVLPDLAVAAVLVRESLPVDRRHNSKVDRAALATWASNVLEGGSP